MSEWLAVAVLAILAVCGGGLLWTSFSEFRDARRKIRARQAKVAERIDSARDRQ